MIKITFIIEEKSIEAVIAGLEKMKERCRSYQFKKTADKMFGESDATISVIGGKIEIKT